MTNPTTQTESNALAQVEKGESLWVGAWHRLRKNKMALIGSVFILVLIGFSFIFGACGAGDVEASQQKMGVGGSAGVKSAPVATQTRFSFILKVPADPTRPEDPKPFPFPIR